MASFRRVNPLIALCVLVAWLAPCHAKTFRLKPTTVIISNTHINMLVVADVMVDDQQSMRQLGPSRYGILRIALPADPLAAKTLTTSCWCIPEFAPTSPPIGHAFFAMGVSNIAIIHMDSAGNAYWFQPSELSNRHVTRFHAFRSRAGGAGWEATDLCFPVDDHWNIDHRWEDGHHAVRRGWDSVGAVTWIASADGESIRLQRLQDPVSPNLAEHIRERQIGYGVFQDGDGIWCWNYRDKPIRTPLTADGLLARSDFLLCPVDRSIAMRWPCPDIENADFVDPLHVCTLSNSNWLTTFNVAHSKGRSLISVRHGDGAPLVGPVIPMPHDSQRLKYVRYLQDRKLLVGVDLKPNYDLERPRLGKRAADSIDIHFWNPMTGEHAVREIYLGARFWFETTMEFRCEHL